ncbi:MAG: universal stress protein [Gammaproteobacteria bacterium]|nr:universal stress protein [Gammaproteobacteria bacterium]NIR97323.1 universal stress protein [Gammaproteobacteria bacterium]NIT63366.1 universal stress protein [Gammaproteobacteria bacterium]NIV20293.1 universal stress protein [Gammaproteobacteria bacterium]NIX10710.1 universal stress protein [Gammaproteobacteria bacterium]
MTEEEPRQEVQIRRILVALDPSLHSRAALESAAELAARLRAELSALFVEDINLMRLAALPFAREMFFGSVTGRRLDLASMEHSLRGQAGRLRRLLEAVAGARRVQWAFEVARGNVTAELVARSSGYDLLILGRLGSTPGRPREIGSTARALIARSSCAVLLLEHGHVVERPVAVLYDGTEPGRRALAMAAQLAERDEHNLVVLIPPLDPERARAVEQQAMDLLGARGIHPRVRRLRADSAHALVEALHAEVGRVLVLGAGEGAAGRRRMEVLSTADFPVVVVRAPGEEAAKRARH